MTFTTRLSTMIVAAALFAPMAYATLAQAAQILN